MIATQIIDVFPARFHSNVALGGVGFFAFGFLFFGGRLGGVNLVGLFFGFLFIVAFLSIQITDDIFFYMYSRVKIYTFYFWFPSIFFVNCRLTTSVVLSVILTISLIRLPITQMISLSAVRTY